MIKEKAVYPLVILSLIFLSNPNVNIIDVLPDCISYILLILVIGSLNETVPYLAECKGAIIKLTLVTFVKIPAFMVMQSNMISGKDIVPLFTLVFTVLELILIYSMVENGFKALDYIGERTDCESVRSPFDIGKNSKFTPDSLKIMTFIFFAARGILAIIPELFLLTPEDAALRKKLMEAYPAIIVISVLAALVIGTIWLLHAVKYAKAIKEGDDLADAIYELSAKETPEEMDAKEKLKKLLSSLSMLAFSSLFIFDITFSDFGEYNKLPHFIYGIMLFIAIFNMSTNKRIRICSIIGTAGFSLSSLLVYLCTARFFESFTYIDIPYSSLARSAYLSIKIFAIIEAAFAVIMLIGAAFATMNFITEHTDIAPSNSSYSETNRRHHSALLKKTVPVFIVAIVINLMKCANIFINENVTVIYSEVNPEGIVASSMPFMSTLIFLISIIFVIYSFVTVSNLKDEVKFKYCKE